MPHAAPPPSQRLGDLLAPLLLGSPSPARPGGAALLAAPSGWEGVVIEEVTLDPREVSAARPTLMVARSMWYRDTHAELGEALARGAAALLVSRAPPPETLAAAAAAGVPVALCEREDPTLGLLCARFYGHPTRALKVYGVTGTNGKTSTVSFLAELLEAAGERVAVMGTVEYRFGDLRMSAPNTTPDALVIQRFARDALRLGATALALEVSSHALALGRVAGVSFDAVGFTHLGRDHLDFHGDEESYREAKGLLFGRCLEESIAAGKRPAAVAFHTAEGLGMLARAPAGAPRLLCAAGGAAGGAEALAAARGALAALGGGEGGGCRR